MIPPPPYPRKSQSRQGVALVITLILLSVITFMAIAFLVLSRGQKSSVTTTMDQAVARLAADSALERAKAELVAPMLAASNEFNFDLLVSTNYISPAGFLKNGAAYQSPGNVCYTYPNGAPLTGRDALQNLANLLYNPRPPVFLTNRPAGGYDFRYYLDLNRNGLFEPTGWEIVTNGAGLPVKDGGGAALTGYFVGDPQWIGELEFPDRPHSANNRFVNRYAYLVVPAGKTLDINYIHNYSKVPDSAMRSGAGDGFFRNQGAGSWEINLGAFLVDLNTNIWQTNTAPYNYYGEPSDYTRANTGVAFDDALALLRYRYSGNQNSLLRVIDLFGLPGATAFDQDFVDGYSAGPPMVDTGWWPRPLVDADNSRVLKVGWSGANNTNHFFTTQDLFDRTKMTLNQATALPTFSDRLAMAGTNVSSYNRYTFYRLLSQLGTDSAPEPPGRINLNYDNLIQKNLQGVVSATNFFSWRPLDFFTNAANRLLLNAGYPFDTTRIEIFPTNFYTPAVHRLLQFAANTFDATTNHNFGLPTVFRPICRTLNNAVFITGYEEITNTSFLTRGKLLDLTGSALTNVGPNDLIYGIPMVIAARKGFPNFNEVAMQSIFQLTRKLQLTRPNPTAPRSSWQTNTMYVMSITNALGVEAWNSYRSNYLRVVDIYVTNSLSMTLTNETGRRWEVRNWSSGTAWTIGQNGSFWPGIGAHDSNPNLRSLLVPERTNMTFLPESVYQFGTASFSTNLNAPFEVVRGFPIPHWGLNSTNRVQFIMVDRGTGRLIDYVHLTGMGGFRDLSQEVADPDFALGFDGMWSTNRLWNDPINGPPQGFVNQIGVCLDPSNDSVDWTSYGPYNQVNGATKQKELEDFRLFFTGSAGSGLTRIQVPFTPTIRVAQYLSWQANDPLVHYLANDLAFGGGGTGLIRESRTFRNLRPLLQNIGQINDRYSPWGGNRLKTAGGNTAADPNAFSLAVKDPLVTGSDAWDFPTNKFPNIGWLGRVHRGTPWQTIYLKSADVAANAAGFQNWKQWTGNFNDIDARQTLPVNDRKLLEVFSTAFNQNATHGQLSVNQNNLAAWSAIFSGVLALAGNTNASQFNAPTNFPWVMVQPAGAAGSNAPLWQLVAAINDVRRTNYSGSFKYLGDVLATPELTLNSPFLNLSGMTDDQKKWGITDAVYERIPQQMMGLLRIDHVPRFVIYSYGQTLKPANHSVVSSGPYIGLCTNYQITAEVASRAVVRIEGLPNRPQAMLESFDFLPPE